MAFDNSTDEIKNQINIVDVIGREVNLKKAGSSYKGLCPFHNEKTPSFSVNEQGQYFNCFGCGKKGDVYRFVMDYYKIPFVDAVEKLCDEYGIKKPEWGNRGPRIDYDKYYAINAKAARFFYNCLGKVPNKGISYLVSRGLSKETITAFGLGYAPPDGSALTDYLRSEGVSDDDLLMLGLSSQGRNGLYDKFRDRVMFPIINSNDKVIGFGGRAIGDIKPKYLNSQESDVFLKKNNLFGLNLTRKEIADEGRAIIVEGYMDLISLYQAGIKNVAASLGTALTDNQARLLCRYTKNIVLSYDSDAAGINAALRGISVINGAGGKAKVMNVTDGKDPDDFVKLHGKDAFLKLADNAMPATDFRLKLAAEGFDLSDDRQILDYIDRIVPVLRSLGPVEQDMYIKKLAEQFNISDHAIALAVQQDKEKTESKISTGRQNADIRRRDMRQEHSLTERLEISFLLLATTDYRYLKRFDEDGIVFRTGLADKIRSAEESLAGSLKPGTLGIDSEAISQALDPDDEARFRRYLSSIQIGPDDEAFYREMKAGYKINNYRIMRSEVQNELQLAEQLGRTEDVEALASKLIELDRLIKEQTEENNA